MTTRIKVGIRLRPFLDNELKNGFSNSRISVDPNKNEIGNNKTLKPFSKSIVLQNLHTFIKNFKT